MSKYHLQNNRQIGTFSAKSTFTNKGLFHINGHVNQYKCQTRQKKVTLSVFGMCLNKWCTLLYDTVAGPFCFCWKHQLGKHLSKHIKNHLLFHKLRTPTVKQQIQLSSNRISPHFTSVIMSSNRISPHFTSVIMSSNRISPHFTSVIMSDML